MNDYSYIYNWSNSALRAMLYSKRCRMVAVIDQWHWIVEFEDGGRLETPTGALKKVNVKSFKE